MLYYLLVVNIVTFVLYGIDKLKSKRGWWRLPEKILFMFAVIGGSIGTLCGMRLYHHKTKHNYLFIRV